MIRLQVQKFLEIFLTLDPRKQGKWTSFLIYQARFFIQIARQLIKDNCLQQAQSLTFTTILSLVPIVALLFSFFRSFANLQRYEQVVQDFLEKHLLAESAVVAFTKIKELSQNVSTVEDVMAVILFLVFSLMLFNTIEGTINSIWRVKKARSFFDRFITYWILVTLGPLLIAVSIQLSRRIGNIAYLGEMIKTVMSIFPISFMVIALVFIYKLVPNTRVRWRPALIGGIVAGIMFELAKSGFNIYVLRLDYYNSVYAYLSVAVFFILWVYVAWIIVLFGTEVSYTIQNLNYLFEKDFVARMQVKKKAEDRIINEILGLRIVWFIIKKFRQGAPPVTSTDIEAWFELEPDVVQEVIRRLEAGNIIVRTAQPQENLVPARSLEKITLAEIITHFQSEFPPAHPAIPGSNAEYIDLIIDQMEKAKNSHIMDISLAEILNKAAAAENRNSNVADEK